MFPPTYVSCDYCCGTFVSLFINLRHPRDFTSHTSRRRTLLLCINMFLLHIGIFFSSRHGSFLVLSAPGHARSPPEHHGASVGPGRGPWHVLWGLKSPEATGRHSEHVELSRPMQTHVQVKKCPMVHAISKILNVGKVVRHYLVMERYFPDTNLRGTRPLLV